MTLIKLFVPYCAIAWAVASLLLQRPRFSPRVVHEGFLIDGVTMGHLFPDYVDFSLPVIVLSVLHALFTIQSWYNRPSCSCCTKGLGLMSPKEERKRDSHCLVSKNV